MSLSAQKVSLQSGATRRLDQIDCEIKPGQLTVLIGPNGSGKTSLIRCLAGDLSPTSGAVILNDKPLHHWTANRLAQHRAVLPQHTQLSFPFQVHEVIALGRSPFKAHKAYDLELIDAAMEKFEISALAERWYTTLSGGEKQRVQLARAWTQISGTEQTSPRYLLLDEPTSALDLKHKQTLMSLIKQATTQQALGVVAALHNLGTAARYADQLILLNHGKVVASGTPHEVLTEKHIEQVYGVSVDFLFYQQSDKEPIILPNPTF